MVIDQRTVITGSFNFTKAAEEKNAENLLVISDAQLAAQYLKNWRTHAEHSEAYEGRKHKSLKKALAGHGPLRKPRPASVTSFLLSCR